MAVRVLLDHGVAEDKITFVTYCAARAGLKTLSSVYPELKMVVGRFSGEGEGRWIEEKYLGC